jgi:hypothetical protein
VYDGADHSGAEGKVKVREARPATAAAHADAE